MAPTHHRFTNFQIVSIHLSAFVEVDTMVLRISSNRKMTSPYDYRNVIFKPATVRTQSTWPSKFYLWHIFVYFLRKSIVQFHIAWLSIIKLKTT